mgnify:CR=1 FL=1
MVPLSLIVGIILAVMGGIGAYYMWQWGSAVTQGVQQAAPGIGAMVGALGMVLSLLPVFMIMMFMMMFMNMFMGLARI